MQLIFAIFAFLTDAELSISKTVSTKSIFRDFFFFSNLFSFNIIIFNSIDKYSDSQNIYLHIVDVNPILCIVIYINNKVQICLKNTETIQSSIHLISFK